MILARAPLRISLLGGGSDLEKFFKIKNGYVISYAINKYVNVLVKESYNNKFIINYSRREVCKNVKEIKHPIIREVLKFFKVKKCLEITSISDLPGKGSGLGSSSAFTVALITCISKLQNLKINKKKIFQIASIIEIEKCKYKIGFQDQFASSFGGLNFIEFKKKKISYKKYKNQNFLINFINKNFFLVPTNIYRNASKELEKHFSVHKKKIINFEKIDNIVKLTLSFNEELKKNRIKNIGNYLNKSWMLKRKLSNSVTNLAIDRLYNKGLKCGSQGGKLLGAGGGGYFLFYVPKKNQKIFLKNFRKLKIIKPSVDLEGVKKFCIYQ